MYEFDCVVIGAGVIGLAIARALSQAGRETLVLEQHDTLGTEISSRNSEVIHAGLYYPSESLKARTCVRGRALLYEYCERSGVSYRRCGKLIVATDPSQLDHLEAIRVAAVKNGVEDIGMLSTREVQRAEPALHCAGALRSPSTGIIDSHGLMLAFLADAERFGASCVFRSPVAELIAHRGEIQIRCETDHAPQIRARWLINSAGLNAVAIARRIEGFPSDHIPNSYLAKGSYFTLSGRAPFDHLVYPLPEPGGLGVHLTLDLAGRARFGPDVQWIDTIDYDVDAERSVEFYHAIRRYWPELPDDSLQPAYAGIRPKISGPGRAPADFRIDGPAQHGTSGVINLFGVESPGLTASLAIAEIVADLIGAD
jgi:L-2-hydroxyglutarate oxidase LhgO